jgi:hypothetical protein
LPADAVAVARLYSKNRHFTPNREFPSGIVASTAARLVKVERKLIFELNAITKPIVKAQIGDRIGTFGWVAIANEFTGGMGSVG